MFPLYKVWGPEGLQRGPQDWRFKASAGQGALQSCGLSSHSRGKREFVAKNESSPPSASVRPTVCRALDLGGGVVYMSMGAPDCDVTPRTEGILLGRRMAAGGGVEVSNTPTVPWHRQMTATGLTCHSVQGQAACHLQQAASETR